MASWWWFNLNLSKRSGSLVLRNRFPKRQSGVVCAGVAFQFSHSKDMCAYMVMLQEGVSITGERDERIREKMEKKMAVAAWEDGVAEGREREREGEADGFETFS